MSAPEILQNFKAEGQKALAHLEQEFSKLQAGRANSGMVENIVVTCYGTAQPLKAVAGVSIPDPRTVQIQPWDKSTLKDIEKALLEANLGLTPNNDGSCIRLNIPQPTEERRTALVKSAKSLAEEAKIAVRMGRQSAQDALKKLELPEDQEHGEIAKLQKEVDEANKKIDEVLSAKEKDIMTV